MRDVDFEVAPRAGRVRGVFAVNGVPLPNPQISVPGFCGTWRSSGDGSFEHIIPAGTYTASVSGPGGNLGEMPFTVTAGQTTEIGTFNSATGSIFGDVTFDGQPVSGDFVSTIFAQIPNVTGAYISTSGRFNLNGIKVGNYDIGVYGNGGAFPAYRLGTVNANAIEGQTTQADVEIAPTAGRVTGRITVNGIPLPNPQISIAGF